MIHTRNTTRPLHIIGLAVAFSSILLVVSFLSFQHLLLTKPEDGRLASLSGQLQVATQRLDASAKQLAEARPVLDRLDATSKDLSKVVAGLDEEPKKLRQQLQDVLKDVRLSAADVAGGAAAAEAGGPAGAAPAADGGGAKVSPPAPQAAGSARLLEARAPSGLLPDAFAEDAEGVFLWEVDQLLRTLPPASLLLAGCKHDHFLQAFAQRFSQIVAADPSPFGCPAVQESAGMHVTAAGLLVGGSFNQKFDLIVLRTDALNISAGPEQDVRELVQAAGRLLSDSGTAIVVVPVAPAADATWMEGEISTALTSAPLFVTNSFAFAYRTPKEASRAWMESPDEPIFRDILHKPVLQALFLQKGIDPAFGGPAVEPSSPGARDVVFSLLRGGSFKQDFADLLSSRRCLRTAMERIGPSQAHTFDEVAFHEGNIPEARQRELQSEMPGLRFADARIYGGFGGAGASEDSWRPWERPRKPGEYPVGYRHMCRFMSMFWWRALRKYEHAMRIDDDVCVTNFGSGNPFDQLRDSRAVYGYGLVTVEKHLQTVHTMQPWLELYSSSRRLSPRMPTDAQAMYFTNFFVSKTSWWMDEVVRQFLSAVDRTGNIYEERWGDAPIQSAALHFFAPPEAVVLVRVDYSHLSTQNEVRNGTEIVFGRRQPNHAPATSVSEEKFYETMAGNFERVFTDLFSPCLVANHFKLDGAPFEDKPKAMRAIKKRLAGHFNASSKEVDKFTAFEAAQALQFDVFHASEPLPPASVVGLERMSSYVQLALHHPRAQPMKKDFTKEEILGLLTQPCCRTPKVWQDSALPGGGGNLHGLQQFFKVFH